MSVGNWRKHIIIECCKCHRLMGFHIDVKEAICNECKVLDNNKTEKETE